MSASTFTDLIAEQDADEDDLGQCPYYARFQSFAGHDPEAECFQMGVCSAAGEPECVTCEPTDGWPSGSTTRRGAAVRFEFITRDDPRWLEGRVRFHVSAYEHLIEGHAHTPSEALAVTARDAFKWSRAALQPEGDK